jgi:hypothetical protein
MSETDNAVVLKGFQPTGNRNVMITALKPQAAADAANNQRFLQAAQMVARMQHPNILPVYASGQSEGITYRVSPLPEGGSLRENLAFFQDLPAMLDLMRQICAGLDYLHGQGYVHGGLQSSSTYLDAQHRPQLSDIGAPLIGGTAQPAHVSPEQAQGGVVDRRTDIYAIGVLTYEVLVGESPPPGIAVSPRAKRPDLPESIERVVLRAMAQTPDQRFQTAGEFQLALQNAVTMPTQVEAAIPAGAPAVTQNVRVSQPKGTNWVAIVLGLLLVVAICGGFSLFIWPQLQGGQETPGEPPVAVQPIPTQVPAEPPTEAPAEQPQENAPAKTPNAPGQPPAVQLPEVCGSLGGAAGLAIFGLGASKRRRNTPRA